MTRPTVALWFHGHNLIAQWSPICFGYSCSHLQGGENENTDIIRTCLHHSTVSK